MLQLVDVGGRSLAAYRNVAPDDTLDEVVRLARELRGARVLHLNATRTVAASRSCFAPPCRC